MSKFEPYYACFIVDDEDALEASAATMGNDDDDDEELSSGGESTALYSTLTIFLHTTIMEENCHVFQCFCLRGSKQWRRACNWDF